MTTKFGWCLDGFHQWSKTKTSAPCPGEKFGRACGCRCHESGMTKAKFFKLKNTEPKAKKTRRK